MWALRRYESKGVKKYRINCRNKKRGEGLE
jgi:hypothetical protein